MLNVDIEMANIPAGVTVHLGLFTNVDGANIHGTTLDIANANRVLTLRLLDPSKGSYKVLNDSFSQIDLTRGGSYLAKTLALKDGEVITLGNSSAMANAPYCTTIEKGSHIGAVKSNGEVDQSFVYEAGVLAIDDWAMFGTGNRTVESPSKRTETIEWVNPSSDKLRK